MVKKFNVGGHKVITILGSFMCAFLMIIVFIWIFAVSSNEKAFKVTMIPVLLAFMFMEFLSMWMIAKNEIGLRRKAIALTGKKAWGTVKESYMSSGRNAQYHLTISYKNEYGQDCEMYTSPSSKLMNKFVEGKRVPILVKGLFAFYDLEALEENLKNERNEEEEEKNYCVHCGAEIGKKDKFCKECGRKQ